MEASNPYTVGQSTRFCMAPHVTIGVYAHVMSWLVATMPHMRSASAKRLPSPATLAGTNNVILRVAGVGVGAGVGLSDGVLMHAQAVLP